MSYQSDALEHHGVDLPAPLQEGVDPYVARTYRYFFAALAGMSVVGMFSYTFIPRHSLTGFSTADGIIWVLCGWIGWRRPVALVFPLFSVITGLMFGQIARVYPSTFSSATWLTLLAFGGLTLFVHIARGDFSFLRGFLCLAFFILFGGLVLSTWFRQPWFTTALDCFGDMAFGCWILYDTSQILERADADLTPGVAAFELILDLVGFQRWWSSFESFDEA